MWIMHDGAPSYFSLIARDHSNATFEDQWIGQGGPNA